MRGKPTVPSQCPRYWILITPNSFRSFGARPYPGPSSRWQGHCQETMGLRTRAAAAAAIPCQMLKQMRRSGTAWWQGQQPPCPPGSSLVRLPCSCHRSTWCRRIFATSYASSGATASAGGWAPQGNQALPAGCRARVQAPGAHRSPASSPACLLCSPLSPEPYLGEGFAADANKPKLHAQL